MKHFILLILLAFSQITICAPRSAMLNEDQIADLQAQAVTRNESEDAKNERKRDLILSALGIVTNAINTSIAAINEKQNNDKPSTKQEAQKTLNCIFNFISALTKRGVEMDPQIKELITELLTACGHLKQSLHLSERSR